MKFQKFEKSFERGTILFREGETNREMYIIHSGRVRIKKQVGGEALTLAVFGPGDFFGEMATLMNTPRSANAEVIDDSRLLVIDHQSFEEVVTKRPEIIMRIVKGLAERLLEANRVMEGLKLKDDLSRMIHTLLRLMAKNRSERGGEGRFPLTIDKLARELSIQRSRATEILDKISMSGMLEVSGDTITIVNSEKLTKYMDFLLKMEGEG
ncbi:MAG: Crp/Fnr family transcriptional regulator [Thermodesulfobacteriota bacterium]